MKKLAVAIVLAVGLSLLGCGSSTTQNGNINGNWSAAFTNAPNGQNFNFNTTLSVNSDGSLSVTKFSFNSSNNECFVSGETESGSFILKGDLNGNVTGQFQYVVTSGTPANNVLTLTGSVNGDTISGQWVLTGNTPTGCSGSGNFTFTKS